jgi:hypothetical protein
VSAYDRDPRVDRQPDGSWLVFPFGTPGSAGRGKEVIEFETCCDNQGRWNMFDDTGALVPVASYKDSPDEAIHALIGDPW